MEPLPSCLNQVPVLCPGSVAPDIVISPRDQPSFHLSHLRGQPVLLAFSLPDWDLLKAESMAQTNRILSKAGFNGELVQLSREGLWGRAGLLDENFSFPLLIEKELTSEAASSYGAAGTQAVFVIDAEGVIQWSSLALSNPAQRKEYLLRRVNSSSPEQESGHGLSRREFLMTAFAAGLAQAMASAPVRAEGNLSPKGMINKGMIKARIQETPGTPVPMSLTVNGTVHSLSLEPRVTLLDALRHHLNLTGSKKGCDHGQCGACTVHVDGKRINSCLALAIAHQGKQITTIEGLAQGEKLDPMQSAFIAHDGFQCGFCTSGQIMSATALLHEPVGPTDEDVREYMSGNLCRCGAYPNIVAAVQSVRKGDSDASV
jgi:xanthine dehydrogenase YagT iron-sulfur-binding subunit